MLAGRVSPLTWLNGAAKGRHNRETSGESNAQGEAGGCLEGAGELNRLQGVWPSFGEEQEVGLDIARVSSPSLKALVVGLQDTFKNLFNVKRLEEHTTNEYLVALFEVFARGAGRTTSAQRRLTSIVNSRAHCEILGDSFTPTMSTGDFSAAAHLLSASCSQAVAWATCVPTEADFKIPPEEYRWHLAHHFRLPVPDRSFLGSHCSDKRHELDDAVHHLFACANHRTFTHNNVRDRLHAFCSDAGLKPVLEPTNLFRHPETGAASQRRPDISVGGVDAQGRLLLLDVTTTDVSCGTSLDKHGSLGAIAGAARGAESRKVDWYEGCFDPATQSFMPIAFELLGRWGPLATRFFEMVKGIGASRKDYTEQRHSFWAGYWSV